MQDPAKHVDIRRWACPQAPNDPPSLAAVSRPGRLTSPSSPRRADARLSTSSTQSHIHFNLDANIARSTGRLSTSDASSISGISRSNSKISRGLHRCNSRANTFQTIKEFDESSGWHPGAEPGVDPLKPDGGHGHAAISDLKALCQITVVDFSQDRLAVQEMDNAALIDFIKLPQPEWVKCRWINVNGLSWDVIQALGQYKGLHRLAVEDIMNTSNRTKADWYLHHAFMILTCQKLIRIFDPDASDDDDDQDDLAGARRMPSGFSLRGMMKGLRRWWRRPSKTSTDKPSYDVETAMDAITKETCTTPSSVQLNHHSSGLTDVFNPNTFSTLQRFRAGTNEARTEFMERNSALAGRGLAVMAEQVAMFVTSDNTVIAFFEQSADDVERPILARLNSPDTILRQSCDASMVGQAIIDAIIDMAIPVAECYADVVGDLELDVLTHPTIKHTKELYIIITEISKVLSYVQPITALITALRDHKTQVSQERATRDLRDPNRGVIITPMTCTYLGDVYDHSVLIAESLNQIKDRANGMIGLIFNTLTAFQNESMKQLTYVTIIFLPMTFITGYFGQNFEVFPEIRGSIGFFWRIAIPVGISTILILMRSMIYEWFVRCFERRHISTAKKRRRAREQNKAIAAKKTVALRNSRKMM